MVGDIEHRSDIEVVFSAADNQIAVLSSPYAIYSIRRIASHSIPGPKEGESVIRRLPSKHVMNWLLKYEQGGLTNRCRVSSNYTTYILVSPSCNIPTNNHQLHRVGSHEILILTLVICAKLGQ